MNLWIDKPSATRKGEALDVVSLEAYLYSTFPTFQPPIKLAQFPSGFSNLTYQVLWGDNDWILRRPPFGARVKSGHDMHREYRILSRLCNVYSKAPRPLAYCEDEAVLGAPFYLMERIEGAILRAAQPANRHPDKHTMHEIARSFIHELASIHQLDYQAAGLEDLGKPAGYVERQIMGWNKRYLKAKTDHLPGMEHVGEWLVSHMPAENASSLIHNDFKYDNLALNPSDLTEVIGVLDWEMATLGDPLMDLGTTLGYWVEADDPPAMQMLKLSPTTLPGNPSRAELASWYFEAAGIKPVNLVFYYVYGLFKIGVIVQQIYYRYKKGHTRDPRFANLIHAVKACSQMAVRAIETGSV